MPGLVRPRFVTWLTGVLLSSGSRAQRRQREPDGDSDRRVRNHLRPHDTIRAFLAYVAALLRSARTAGLGCQPEWSTRDRRQVDRAEIHAAIASLICTKPTEHWIPLFNEAGVTCGPIYTTQQAFEDEQVRELGVAVPVDHPILGRIDLVGSPLNFAGTSREIRRATPDSGADDAEILRRLGYPDEQIAELRAQGVC